MLNAINAGGNVSWEIFNIPPITPIIYEKIIPEKDQIFSFT